MYRLKCLKKCFTSICCRRRRRKSHFHLRIATYCSKHLYKMSDQLEITDSPLDSETTLEMLTSIVHQVRSNFEDVLQQYTELKQMTEASPPIKEPVYKADTVTVSRLDLDRLEKETAMLRENLQKVLTPELTMLPSKIESIEEELQTERKKAEESATELDHWKSRCDTALAEVDKVKEEKFGLQVELQAAGQQLEQQVEFSSCMGAACGTLLWRVSRCEESVQAILVGTKVDEFLAVVSSTLESYVMTYKTDVPNETEDETQFVLSLCGITTNIAASPFGREFLMKNESGRQLVETFLTILREAPNKQCAKMKNLILMALYNLSINQRGLKLITCRPGIVSLLTWIVQEETVTENRLHALRLIQSLLYEQQSPELLSEANEVLTGRLLQQLAADPNRDIRETALELGTDLKAQLKELQFDLNDLDCQDDLCEQ